MALAEAGNHPLLIRSDHHGGELPPPTQCCCQLSIELFVVLADPTGQGQHVDTAEAGGYGTEYLQQPVTKHIQGSDGTVMPVDRSFTDFTHVTAEAGQSL